MNAKEKAMLEGMKEGVAIRIAGLEDRAKCLSRENDVLRAENERLQAIVGQYPTTAEEKR